MIRWAAALFLTGLCLTSYAEDAGDSEEVAGSKGRLDSMHATVDDFVQNTVRAFDGFFVNTEHATFTDRKTRIRLRLNSDYIQNHGWDFSPKLKLHLVLPGLEERLRLVINDDMGSDTDQGSTSDDTENDVALRWIGRQNERMGISFDLGLRIKSGKLDPFGRVNLGFEYPLPGSWMGQSTNRLYYYSKTAWRNDFRQYFNYRLADNLLFRSRTRLQYFDENVSNPFVEQKFTLFHALQSNRAVAYEMVWRQVSEEDSPFNDDEIIGALKNNYQQFAAQIRIRQQFLRPWFFVEFWPIVGWPEERDYRTTLAARLRLEVNFGGSGDSRLDE